jgi:hypothetical protein
MYEATATKTTKTTFEDDDNNNSDNNRLNTDVNNKIATTGWPWQQQPQLVTAMTSSGLCSGERLRRL